jgi:hypothetical protein
MKAPNSRKRRMPFAYAWRKTLNKKKGKACANHLIERAQSRYAALYSSQTKLSTRTLQIHHERAILPALAMYQALRDEGENQETALETAENLFSIEIKSIKRFIELVGRMPFFFKLVRALIQPVMKVVFPQEGWKAEWIDEIPQIIAFNIRGCVYFETLSVYGAPELGTIFCALDNFVFDEVSPYIRWERTQTIARGGEFCDFRFYPKETNDAGR